MAKNGTISIACASAFWGDTPLAVGQLLQAEELDVIAFDYLSEVTMSLLARAQKKDPRAGYAPDFLTDVIEPHLKICFERGIKLISNAGGINSPVLMEKIIESAKRQGLSIKVICVEGDDLRESPHLSAEQNQFLTANAYLGATGIVEALAQGADIVLTGRTVDTALVTGPLLHFFGEAFDNYDFLAQASLAGHIIECGTQATGGNFTDWKSVPGQDNVGFPIVRFEKSGRFTVTKPKNTGGLVSPLTVAEQIVYEIGDPKNYVLPDVVCDFTGVRLTQVNDQEVSVEGAKGQPPTSTYKVSATAQVGWRISATAFIGGGDALEKASAVGETLLLRAQHELKTRGMQPYTETRVEALGGGENALLRVSAAHAQPAALDVLAKEVAPAATSLAPGMTNLLGGRAQAMPRMAFSSFLIDKSAVSVWLSDGTQRTPVKIAGGQKTPLKNSVPLQVKASGPSSSMQKVKLERLALARSGDKGNHVNIGVIARTESLFPVLRQALTADRVREFFKDDFDAAAASRVDSWELPGIHSLNFLLYDCLGGGGSFSLRIDPQGKAFAQRLLQMTVEVPKGIL